MNTFIKKNSNRVLRGVSRIIKDKKKIASFTSWLSKIYVERKNRVIYSEKFDMFWQVSGNTYLQIDASPVYDFSYQKYKERLNTIFCRKYDLHPSDVIVDLGAGIGAEIPFYLERILNTGHIYAIEASPDSFDKLKVLCSQNNCLTTVSLHNCAISDTNDSVWIEETNLYRANQINTDKRGIEIEAFTLDEFVKNQQIEKIDFLKMNIEGAELQVIKGMDETVKKVQNFAISCHDFLFEEKTQIKETVISYFEKNGFEVEEISTGNKYYDSWIYGKKVS